MVPSAVVTGSGENAYLCACVDQEANSRPSVGDKQTATTRRGKARRAGRHQFLAAAFPEGSEVDGWIRRLGAHKVERTSVLHFQNVGGNSTHRHGARCDLATAHGCAKSSGGVTGQNWNGGSTIDHEMVASVQLLPSAQPPPHEGRQHQRTRMIPEGPEPRSRCVQKMVGHSAA